MRRFRLSKNEILRSKTKISQLYSQGKSLLMHPLKIRYFTTPKEDKAADQELLFSAPKKLFPLAVDRNKVKRILKEIYRKNKALLKTKEGSSVYISIIYIDKSIPKYASITTRLTKALKILSKKLLE